MDDKTSDFFYCGTTTGDILAINMESKRFQYKTPEKCNFQRGVTALVRLPNGNFLVGSGCGILAELCFPLGRNGDKSPKIKIDRFVMFVCVCMGVGLGLGGHYMYVVWPCSWKWGLMHFHDVFHRTRQHLFMYQ